MGSLRRTGVWLAAPVAAAILAGCPPPTSADYIVEVGEETFVLRLTDPETIRLASGQMWGENRRFPAGPLRPGNGGFNAPWTWHLDPAETRMVERAIEACDGSPSYVETHQAEFPVYCPWGARIRGRWGDGLAAVGEVHEAHP
jgi:hypothetical protein